MVSPAVVTEFPRAVVTRDDWIELSDGCRLFARTVLPADAAGDPVPAILEFLPYRLTDGTAHRDGTTHPYFAGHGYAGVRVDIRGTGNSDGILLDEYLPQEQSDGCEVIAWLARQPWCSGAVGIYGKSWGGFNGLQIAAHQPPALRAVITAYFTDDRYADDVHYMGGCLLGHEALSWASTMLGLNALPPDPRIVGERWREMWRRRLRDTPFFAEEWLRHQRRDAFWQQGSVGEDFGAIAAPTLLVGGWADGYTNAVGRTLAGLTAAGVPCRALLGPWSHGWPQVSEPGPRIGFLQECLRWWDHWLKGVDRRAMDAPLLRAWLQEYDPPAPGQAMRSGRWIAQDAWPPLAAATHTLFPAADGRLLREPDASAAQDGGRIDRLIGSARSGADAGAWCPYGEPVDFPADQRAEDGLALSYTTPPLRDRLEVLGVPAVTLELTVDRPLALVAVRLCDVAPDGRSLLVARGLLNLTHRDSHAAPAPMPVGEPTIVRVALDLTGHAFAVGHRIRLALSPTYWPFAWPSPEPVTLAVALGAGTRLDLPTHAPAGDEGPAPSFAGPEQSAPPAGPVRHTAWRTHTREDGTGRVELEVGGDEHSRLDDERLEFGERVTRRYSLTAGDPLSAQVRCEGEHFLRRDDWRVTIRLRTALTCTATRFVVTRELEAYEGEARIHVDRTRTEIPRDGV